MACIVRRRILIASATAMANPPWLSPALAQAKGLRPTPHQTEGPFYPTELPADSDADLLKNGKAVYQHGQPTWVEGTVTDLAGVPVAGAVVEIWQCDHQGRYHHPGDGGRADPTFQGFGQTAVGRDGRYRFRTLKPVPYTGRTPHIHFKVKLNRTELLTTQLYVAGSPGNERDGIWRRMSDMDRAAVTVPFIMGGDGMHATFPIVVQV